MVAVHWISSMSHPYDDQLSGLINYHILSANASSIEIGVAMILTCPPMQAIVHIGLIEPDVKHGHRF